MTRPVDNTESLRHAAIGRGCRRRTPTATRPRREPWRDPARPADERVADLLSRMTLAEKIAQLGSVWQGASGEGDGVAPMQDQFNEEQPPLDELIKNGLGQLTRVFGSRPVPAAAGMRALAGLQARIVAGSRFGIPAVAHEECLTGFAAWGATIYPTPLAWGASFDPALVARWRPAFGATMRAVGVHQGLAPVLDVTRDYRWGRVEETIGEDPYLVGTIGTAYVQGLQSAGLQATLKHFAGYSASRAGRNHAPVSMGPREFADVILPPFEMAIRLGGARSVMPTYIDLDGVPASADPGLLDRPAPRRARLRRPGRLRLLRGLLPRAPARGRRRPGGAAALALAAGLDVELPSTRCYGDPLRAAATAGDVAVELIDRAAARVLRQKFELGLLDRRLVAVPAGDEPDRGRRRSDRDLDLDPPAQRDIARRLAEESVVLLANDRQRAAAAEDGPGRGHRPARRRPARVLRLLHACRGTSAPGGSTAAAAAGRRGRHAARRAPRGAARRRLRAAAATSPPTDRSGFAEAVATARSAEMVVAVVGDEAGLFGHGTSGEGCDVTDLRLPGVQQDLLQALADTGTPVVAVLVTGRPYALGGVAGRLAAVVQAFFPGEEGGHAIAGVLTGRVTPSGKLPVEIPRLAGAQPSTYLRSRNAALHAGSSVDPTPLFAFGHGLSYTTFGYSDLELSADRVPTDGGVGISCTVRNTGAVAGTEVVQLYLGDPVSSVVRPVRWLAGFARVPLARARARGSTFRLHADRTAFTGPGRRRGSSSRARSRSPSAARRTTCRCPARSR